MKKFNFRIEYCASPGEKPEVMFDCTFSAPSIEKAEIFTKAISKEFSMNGLVTKTFPYVNLLNEVIE